jgi:hypothetical protein
MEEIYQALISSFTIRILVCDKYNNCIVFTIIVNSITVYTTLYYVILHYMFRPLSIIWCISNNISDGDFLSIIS